MEEQHNQQNPTGIEEPNDKPETFTGVDFGTEGGDSTGVTPVSDKPPVNTKVDDSTDIVKLLSQVDKGLLLKSEAVQSLLESARQQEKNKLYKTLESKDDTIKQLNETIKDLQAQLKTKEEQSMEGEKLLLQQLQEMKEAQEKLIKEMEEEKKKARQAELEAYKTKKINEANGELIVDLVGGNSEEEIDASIEKAKQRYLELIQPYKAKLEELEEKAGKPKRENAPKPSNPQAPSDLEFTADQIKAMSPSDYAKYRERLLKMANKPI